MSLLSLPPLSALIHQEKLLDGSPVWVALCPELDIASQGFNPDEARAMLLEAVAGFLEVASPAEIKACLADAQREKPVSFEMGFFARGSVKLGSWMTRLFPSILWL